MTKVAVTKSKLDTLAEKIGIKSKRRLPLTIDEMGEAVDSIELNVEPEPPKLQAKTRAITGAGTFTDTPDSGYDGLSSVTVTVPEAEITTNCQHEYYTDNGVRKWRFRGITECVSVEGDAPGFIEDNTIQYSNWATRNAIAKNTTITPTESSQTIGGANYMMEGAVTVAAIDPIRDPEIDIYAESGYVYGTYGYYPDNIVMQLPSGTEGTPTATKGTVSNHAISVTPSVTNSAGYISGGTKTGTAVSVTASELVSGNKEITENGTNIDVANYSTVSVAVPTGSVTQDSNGFIVLPETGGGGGGSTNCVCGTFTTSSTTDAASTFTIPYTGSGYPIYLAVYIDGGVYNSTSGGNTDWVELVHRYAYGSFSISKLEMNTEPTYNASASLTNNLGYVTYLYKNSTTDPTSMATSGSLASVVAYNSGDATSTGNEVVRFKNNGTTVSYFVASTGRGLLADTTYAYIAVYSS